MHKTHENQKPIKNINPHTNFPLSSILLALVS